MRCLGLFFLSLSIHTYSQHPRAHRKVLHVWQAVHFVDKKMTKPRQGRLALLETMLAFVRNDEDEW